MFLELFQKVGLSKNEAQVYESLLKLGKSSVSDIAEKTNINRRNIYDVLNRLMEEGLVFMQKQKNKKIYKPVDPIKLKEKIKEKEKKLDNSMEELKNLYESQPKENEVYIYKGPEGWKNYMRDILRVGEPVYFLAAKGEFLYEKTEDFFPIFYKEAKKKDLDFYVLFDYEVKSEVPEILNYIEDDMYKFLPKDYSTDGGIDIFGNHVNLLSNTELGGFKEEFSFTVVINEDIANSFRVWFKYMWDMCPDIEDNENSVDLEIVQD